MMYAARESDSSLKSSPLIMRLDSVYSFRFFSNPKLVLFCTGIDLAPGVGTCIHCQLGTLFVSEATKPSSHCELWTLLGPMLEIDQLISGPGTSDG